MKKNISVFFKYFTVTLFILLLPVLTFKAFCTVYENCGSVYDLDTTAFYIDGDKLVLFDKEFSLSALGCLGRIGKALIFLSRGIIELFVNIITLIGKILYN